MTPSDVVAKIKSANSYGDVSVRRLDGKTRLVNEFWTSRQRQSHSLHEISYRACFKAELPEFFIRRLSSAGDTVLDPFMGRGTTVIQSAIMNRVAWGGDSNPLSLMLTEPRLNRIDLDPIRRELAAIPDGIMHNDRSLLEFYHPATLRNLETLRHRVHIFKSKELDWIRMVAMNRLSGHSSGFFSGRTMPPNQTVSLDAQKRLNARLKETPPYRNIKELIYKKSKSLLRDGCLSSDYRLYNGMAWDSGLPDNSVDLVITSPPFLDIVDYKLDNWLRAWFAKIDLASVDITTPRSVNEWEKFMALVLAEMSRVTKSGKYVCVEVGDAKGIDLSMITVRAGESAGMTVVAIVINEQNFTKTSNCWGVHNNTKGVNSNKVVIFHNNKRSKS